MKNYSLLLIFLFSFCTIWAQDYRLMIAKGTYTVAEIQSAADVHFARVGTERGRGYKSYKRWEYQALRNMDENGMLKSPEFYFNELERYNRYLNQNFTTSKTIVGNWEELGPLYWNQTSGWNPGVGRITSIAAENGNADHMIVGANSGGVWKTLDGGVTWVALTDDLSNLVVYALAIDPTNPSTYFWGSTSGTIFKSIDAGATWSVLADTGGGNVNKILVDPSNTNKMYCSVEGGGIFKSTDAGNSWALIDSSATNGYDVEFKPGNTNVIYASGNVFYKSVDGGQTFQAAAGNTSNPLDVWSQEYVSGNTDWDVASSNQNNTVTPRTGNAMAIFYIGNFTQPTTNLITPALNLSGATNPTVNFSYTNVNWEGDIDTMRVLYKTSAVGIWIELAEYTAESTIWTDISLALPNTTSTYYIAFEGTSYYGRGLTLDDISITDATLGVVFEQGFDLTGSNTFANGPKMIGVSIDDPEVVYMLEAQGGTFKGFHRSDDSGTNFFQEYNHLGKNYFGYDTNAADDRGQAPRDMDIAVNPNDVNDVHIAGINTWRSTDGGTNFSISSQWVPGNAASLNIGYCHADVDILEFIEDKLYVGTDGGVYVADNPTVVNSTYYRDLTTGLGIRQFYKIGVSQTDPAVISGGAQDNGSSVRGTDGVWSDWLGADGMESFVDKNDNSILYGTSQFGSLYKSTNGGLSLSGIDTPSSGNWVTPFEQDPIVPNTIYTGYSQVYKSINGGGSWNSISQDFGGNLNHLKIAPSNSNVMYAAIGNRMFKNESADVNTVWTEIPGILGNINSIAIHPSDPDKIAIATTNNRKVFVSVNGGATWSSYQLNLPNFNAQAVAWHDNGDDGLYLGMNYGVYYIDNTYTEWQPFSNGLPNVSISELEINTADEKLYAATYGRGLWSSEVFDATLSVSEFDLESFNLYPNPAKNEVTLSWNKSEDVTIRIFDVQGKLMHYAKNQNIYEPMTIEISNYASGLYFVKVNTIKGFVTKKLVIE